MSIDLRDRPVQGDDSWADADPVVPKGCEFVDGVVVPKGGRWIDGVQVESGMSELSNWVGAEIDCLLRLYVRKHRLGVVFNGSGEQGLRCFIDKPRMVRKPDVAFLSRDWSKPFLSHAGFTRDVPELVVEVISPNDLAHELSAKVEEFLLAGTKLVWVIDPELRVAYIHRSTGVGSTVKEPGNLSGEDVLPGFVMPLADVLPPV